MTTSSAHDEPAAGTAAEPNTDTDTPRPQPIYVTTLDEVRSLAAIPLASENKPNVAGLLGCGRHAVYALADSGEIPTLRLGQSGGKRLALVPPLRRLLGDL